MRLCHVLVLLLLAGGAIISLTVLGISPGTDSSTATSDAQSLGHGYQRSGGHILFKGKRIDREGRRDIDEFARDVGHPLTLCRDVDAASFEPLSEEYSKDKHRVYYKWISPGRFWVVELPDADPDTFTVLDFNLARDDKHVWKADTVIVGADPATAKVVNPHWTWKDRNRVYYQSEVLEGADPVTFRHLGQGFYADATHVYWCTTELADADVKTFETFGDVPYARDRSHVWSGPTILRHVDAQSFQFLHNHVYKDSKHVFASTKGLEVIGADPATFEKIGEITGHTSVFEPEKQGLSFLGHDAVLFRDSKKFYVFEPDYSEMYTLETQGDVIVVSKPVRTNRSATVSARLKGDTLSEPVSSIVPGNPAQAAPMDESSTFKRYLPLFLAAREKLMK